MAGPLPKKIAGSLCALLIAAALLGAPFNAFPGDHACTHDGSCPVCTACEAARALVRAALCQGPERPLPPHGPRTRSPGRPGGSPVSLSSVDLKVRLNT
jgi:hypothetical protein